MAQKREISQFQPAMDRLKRLATHSGDRLLLADGPPNPDAELLDLCSTVLHHLKEAEKAYRDRPIHKVTLGTDRSPEEQKLDDDLMAAFRRSRMSISPTGVASFAQGAAGEGFRGLKALPVFGRKLSSARLPALC